MESHPQDEQSAVDRLGTVQAQIVALEQQLVAARHLYAQLESQRQSEQQAEWMRRQTISQDEQFRVNVAMGLLSQFQQAMRPALIVREDGAEAVGRDPEPKELAALSAACDYLERFFD